MCAGLGVALPARAAAPDPELAAEGLPPGMPAAALAAEPPLPEADGWPFSEDFSRISGTSRLDAGALLWTDWLYDDTGAGDYTYSAPEAAANGADVFRAAVAVDAEQTYWRVDWNTLADATVPVAAWTFDTDAEASTGDETWPASAGAASPGIDASLVVSSRGAWWTDTATGVVSDLAALGGTLTVDPESRSFVVAIPRDTVEVAGTWTTRLAAGVADAAGTGFASAPESPDGTRIYNAAFRDIADEPHVISAGDASTEWNNAHQSERLAAGDVTDFAVDVDWARLLAGESTDEPVVPGYSTRWYVSSADLGQGMDPGARRSPGPAVQPATFFGRVQPYTVYVPSGLATDAPAPLTILLHGGNGNHNAFATTSRDAVFGPMCEERRSICVAPLGRGMSTWYINEAELDVWEVWNRMAGTFRLDPDRTVIGGFSMGGVGASHFVTNHPHVFAAATIVSGAGYFNTAGQRDREGAYLRVENLGDLRTFIDSGSNDIALANTRVWDRTMQEAGIAYRAHYYDGADHGMLGSRIGWGDAAEYAAAAPPRDSAPASVVFRWEPGDERPDLGMPVDRAYWLSDLEPRDATARWSRITATSGSLDTVERRTVLTDEIRTLADGTAQVRDQQLVEAGDREARPRIEVTLENVTTAAVDLDVAAADAGAPTSVSVTSDGAATLRFVRGTAAAETAVPSGTSEIAAPAVPTAVTVDTADGDVRVRWAAPSSDLPITAYVVRDADGRILCETTDTDCLANGAGDPGRVSVTAASILGTSAPAFSADAAPAPAPGGGTPSDPAPAAGTTPGGATRAGALATTGGTEPTWLIAVGGALLLLGGAALGARRLQRKRS
jgi:LPXTG-motif cell wall-anchored protein